MSTTINSVSEIKSDAEYSTNSPFCCKRWRLRAVCVLNIRYEECDHSHDGIIAKHDYGMHFYCPRPCIQKFIRCIWKTSRIFDFKTRKFHSDDEACPLIHARPKINCWRKKSVTFVQLATPSFHKLRRHLTSCKFINGLSLLVIFDRILWEKKKGDKSHCEKVLVLLWRCIGKSSISTFIIFDGNERPTN